MATERGVDFGFKCRDCPRARNYGAAKLRAEIEAGKHARRYDWHTVDLTETRITHTFSARDNQMELLDTEKPPF